MNNRWFWKTWHTTYTFHFFFLTTLAVVALILFSWYHYRGVDNVIAWEKFQEQQTVETSIHEFSIGPFEVSIPTEVYLVSEFFQGGRLLPNVFASYFFVFTLAVAFVYLLAIFSALDRFWYLASSALVILFLVSLRLDVLQVVSLKKSWFSISVIATYLLPSFYFNAFSRSTSFPIRLSIFASITVVLAVIIYSFASVQQPFLYLGVTGYVPGIVLTILFMMMVAHEIPAAFLYLTSHSLASKGLKHFLIIMIIYLLNLVLLYMNSMHIIDWSIGFINIYVIFSVTAIVGLWGWKHRESLYGNIMPFAPFGAYFYLALCSVAFSMLAFMMGSANDAGLKVLADMLLFCHIGFGLILLLYVFSNFLKVIDQNLSAWKVLYKPNRMPYETFRLGGIIVIVSFMIYNGWRDYVNYSFSGFWTAMADLYVKIDRADVAQLYYEQGRTYGYGSHHANYAKAYYYSGEFQWAESHEYYQRAGVYNPSAYAFANDANVYNWEGSSFKAIFSLKDALKKMPDEPHLINNLGFSNGKVHALDTALQLLSTARSYSSTKASAETNFAALIAQERIPVSPDSLAEMFSLENTGVAANVLGTSVITGMPLHQSLSILDEKAPLTLHSATWLNNYLLAKAYAVTQTELEVAERIARDSANLGFDEPIKNALAHAHYLQGNVGKALQLMSELSFVSASHQGKYNFIVGLWLLEQGDASGAATAFRYAINFDYNDASFYLAIAETEDRNIPEATYWWDSLQRSPNAEEQRLASSFKPLLNLSLGEALKSNDAIKYQFTRYKLATRDTVLFNVIMNQIQDVNYKGQAYLDMAIRQLEADNTATADRYIEAAESQPVTNQRLKREITFARLRVKACRGDLDRLAELVKDVDFSSSGRLDKLYYEGLLNDAAGNSELADKAFAILASANPFYEEGIIAAAEYARARQKDPHKPYEILSEAVQVNKTSVRLWKAYIGESLRMGYDNYAVSARAELQKLLVR